MTFPALAREFVLCLVNVSLNAEVCGAALDADVVTPFRRSCEVSSSLSASQNRESVNYPDYPPGLVCGTQMTLRCIHRGIPWRMSVQLGI